MCQQTASSVAISHGLERQLVCAIGQLHRCFRISQALIARDDTALLPLLNGEVLCSSVVLNDIFQEITTTDVVMKSVEKRLRIGWFLANRIRPVWGTGHKPQKHDHQEEKSGPDRR